MKGGVATVTPFVVAHSPGSAVVATGRAGRACSGPVPWYTMQLIPFRP